MVCNADVVEGNDEAVFMSLRNGEGDEWWLALCSKPWCLDMLLRLIDYVRPGRENWVLDELLAPVERTLREVDVLNPYIGFGESQLTRAQDLVRRAIGELELARTSK